MNKNRNGCVSLKRQGADHVAKLLKGKTSQDELEFWQERTKRLQALRK